jgi:hypothetical protein
MTTNRTSKTRVYTHAVVVVTVDAEKLAAHFDDAGAEPGWPSTDWYRKQAAEIRRDGDNSRCVVTWLGSAANAAEAARSTFHYADCQRVEIIEVAA